jgi:hypothetical protein
MRVWLSEAAASEEDVDRMLLEERVFTGEELAEINAEADGIRGFTLGLR